MPGILWIAPLADVSRPLSQCTLESLIYSCNASPEAKCPLKSRYYLSQHPNILQGSTYFRSDTPNIVARFQLYITAAGSSTQTVRPPFPALSTRRLSLHHTMSASNPQLIVLFCIIGTASSVTIGFAVSRLFGRNSEDDTAPNTMRRAYDEQRLYMRDVRIQNRMLAEQEAMGSRSADRYAKRPGEIVNEVARYS